MPVQYFLLDSNHADYTAALAALATLDAAKYSFTPTQTLRDQSGDVTLKIVKANVTEAELNGNTDLVNCRTANYPNEFCRHRFSSLENFRALGGFHMLGESVRGFAGISGQDYKFIRPQLGASSTTADNYGEHADGSSHYDACNGESDPELDVANLGTAIWNKKTAYYFADGVHCTRAHPLLQAPDQTNGVTAMGNIIVEDATLAADDKIFVTCDWDMMPAIILGGYTLWDTHSNLPWEEYTTGIYVNGAFSDNGLSGQSVGEGSGAVLNDADVEDITLDATTLLKRHKLKGQATLAALTGNPGRFYSQGNGDEVVLDSVFVDDTSTFTDVTTEAGDGTANDFEVLAVSAPNGSAIYFGADTEFSGFLMNLSQVQVGGTGVWEYSRGESGWNTFTNIDDPSSGFTSGTGNQWLQFNPKADWATDTVNAVSRFWVRWRKTSGTVTQAARGDQIQSRPAAMFIHRWNGAAPTRGLCSSSLTGIRLDLNGKGNCEYVRCRTIANRAWNGSWNEATDITVSGGQYAEAGAMSYASGTPVKAFQPCAYGTRHWSIDDHLHKDKSDPFIQSILAKVQDGIDAGINLAEHGVEPDLAAFDDLGEWCDFVFVGTGPYGSGSVNWTFTIDGMKVRHPGDKLNNDSGDEVVNADTVDNHALAYYGNHDHTNDTYKRIGVETGNNCIDFYAQATGNTDAPVDGASSAHKNAIFSHGYCSGVGNQDDVHTPVAIIFENDPDVGHYDDGTGGNTGNKVYFWGAKDMRNALDDGGGFEVTSSDDTQEFKYCYIDNPGTDGAYSTTGGFSGNGPRSTNVLTFDGTSTFVDITDNVKRSGNTATELYPTGAAGEILYLGIRDRHLRKFGVTITTAGVGGPTLAFEYHNGTSWTAVTNLSDGTSGLTTSGTITWDRPADAQQVLINGLTYHWARIRIVSGSFSTIPQSDEIDTYLACGSVDFQFNRIVNVDAAVNCRVGWLLHGVGTAFTNSGIIIDDNNVIELGAGQDSTTQFYGISGVNNYTLASWQAFTKPALTTDALQDSVFGTNNSLEAA